MFPRLPFIKLVSPKPQRVSRPIERDTLTIALADGREVEILRVRDPRARRIKLSLDERGVRLTIPLRASLKAGNEFLHAHRDWLAAQLAAHSNETGSVTLVRGITSSLPLRGELLSLHWHEGSFSKLELIDGALHFHLARRAGDAAMKRALRDFYEAQARSDIGQWLPKYLSGLPQAPRKIRFKMISTLWGSLAPDASMTLDLALVLGNPEAFEYVLVHELCHLLHRDHSPKFWHEVETRFPAWREQRGYFHAEGRRLKAQLRGLLS